MGIPGSANPLLFGSAAVYEIEQSLRFNSADSAFLYRTPASAGNQKKYTISVWVKRTGFLSSALDVGFLGAGDGTTWGISGTGAFGASYNGKLMIRHGGANVGYWNVEFRDPSAWYHFVIAVDTDQGTAANRNRLYVNGVEQPAPTGSLGSGTSTNINAASIHSVGTFNLPSSATPSAGYFTNALLAEYNFIDGQQLDYTSFGQFNDNGVWRPKQYTGSYGTNGFYLKFDPSATNGIGHDHSGNGNNWTDSGFTTSSTGTDVLSDTPTDNFCTLNPLDTDPNRTTAVGPTNGNLDASVSTFSSVQYVMRAATFASNGKDYFEVTKGDSVNKRTYVGFLEANGVRSGPGNGGIPYDFYGYGSGDTASANTAFVVSDGTAPVTSLPALDPGSSGDVLMVAHDRANKKIWFGKNGTWFTIGGTVGNPATGTAPAITYTTDAELLPCIGAGSFASTTIRNLNFGQRAFAYTPPTDFSGLSTSTLSEPTVKDGSEHFNATLWTGTSAEHAITGVGFQPDWSWIKGRTNNTNHVLSDVLRGSTEVLESDSTAIAYTDTQSVKSFDSDGVTLGTSNDVNNSASGLNSYVGWFWKAGGSGSLNVAGSIDSTVSTNLAARFSIVSWAAEASAGTVGHGLGFKPQLIIMKDRDTSSYPWLIYHQEVGIQKYIPFSQLTPVSASTAFSTAPTTTVFDPGTGVTTGNSYGDLIAYCFAEVEGYSKFGSYTGNASNDGTFVYCGFKPAFVLIKRTDANSDWIVIDTARNSYNAAGKWLLPNSAIDEYDYDALYPIDILSNGFKLRTLVGSLNTGTFIYATFAENPFGGSGVSPATAR